MWACRSMSMRGIIAYRMWLGPLGGCRHWGWRLIFSHFRNSCSSADVEGSVWLTPPENGPDSRSPTNGITNPHKRAAAPSVFCSIADDPDPLS